MRKKSTGSYDTGTSRYSAYQRANHKEGSPHYVFLYSDDEFGDEEIALQPRKQTNSQPKKVEVINVNLKPEDTLQALALRYRCTVSELKRINNIHKENEIFARRTVKVPVHPFSIFTEMNHENEVAASENELKLKKEEEEETDNKDKLIDLSDSKESNNIANILASNVDQRSNLLTPISLSSLSSLPSTSQSPSSDINNVILNSVCEPLPLKDNINTIGDDESDELLIRRECEKDATPEERVIKSLKCSGADWDLTWIHLLGVSVLLGIIIPLFYIFCIAEKTVSKHHNNDTTDAAAR